MQPREVGAFLDEKEVEALAKTIFNRFYYEYGFQFQWNDNNNARLRRALIKSTKQMLDGLAINGFDVVKSTKKEIGKKFLSKASIDV